MHRDAWRLGAGFWGSGFRVVGSGWRVQGLGVDRNQNGNSELSELRGPILAVYIQAVVILTLNH